MSTGQPPQIGDVYFMSTGLRIKVTRTARDLSWADIVVSQPSGASWRKRQPLQDQRFPFEVSTRPPEETS